MTVSDPLLPLAKKALFLATPIAGAYLVVVAGLLVEFIIVGNELGGPGIAALGLAGTLALVLVLAFHAIEIGAQAIIARRYGEGDLRATGSCLDNALALSFGLGVPLTLCLYALGPRVFGAESAEIETLAFTYFRWRLPSVPFLIGTLAVIGFFNAIGKPKIPMYIYALILSLNALFCYGFVGGNLGFAELGIRGAGLAQTLSTILGFTVFVLMLLRRGFRERHQCLYFARNLRLKAMGAIAKISGPVFVQQFFGNFGMYLFVIINGKVPDGGVSLAASTIARQVGYLTYLPSIGFGIAAATLVGQALGAKEPKNAMRSGYLCWGLGAIFMVTIGLCFILFRSSFIDLFLRTNATEGVALEGAANVENVKRLAEKLLIIVGCYQIFESMNTIIAKALQGAGDTLFVMGAAVGFQWLFFLPLAWFFALPLEMGAVGALLAFGIQLSLVGTVFFVKFQKGAWKKKSV